MIDNAQFSLSLLHPKHWPFWLGIALARLLALLPFKIQMQLGKGLGNLVYKLIPKRVQTARRNLELCFPDKREQEREALLIENFQQTGKAVFDTINAWWWSDNAVQKHMNIRGQEHVEQAIESGHGVILFAVHCLPLEMGARVFGQFKPGIGVYRKHNHPVMEYLQVKGRLRSNKGMVQKRDLRQMVKCLRNKEVIWYTADQDFGHSTAVFIPFFAVPDAATITGATSLAKLGKAKVLPFSVQRDEENGGYNIRIDAPLTDFPGENAEADAQRGNRIIESIILEAPHQYMWLHRRFKSRPSEQSPSYY